MVECIGIEPIFARCKRAVLPLDEHPTELCFHTK